MYLIFRYISDAAFIQITVMWDMKRICINVSGEYDASILGLVHSSSLKMEEMQMFNTIKICDKRLFNYKLLIVNLKYLGVDISQYYDHDLTNSA
jgi:hypothetical protein